jgi:hypothetical protein
MNKIHKFPANRFITTPDHSITVGEKYHYSENSFQTTVEVIEINQMSSEWYIKVKHEVELLKGGEKEVIEQELVISFSTQILNTEHEGIWQLQSIA